MIKTLLPVVYLLSTEPICSEKPVITEPMCSGQSIFLYILLFALFFILGFASGLAYRYKTGYRRKRKYNYRT